MVQMSKLGSREYGKRVDLIYCIDLLDLLHSLNELHRQVLNRYQMIGICCESLYTVEVTG